MRQKHIRYLILFLTVFLISIQSFYAVDSYIAGVYGKIDDAFLQKDTEALGVILQAAHTGENYDLIESYTLKKIRRLIVAGEYEQAQGAVLVVIDNNLDNTEAVEMYSAIDDSMERQKQYEAEQNKKQQAELARIEAEKQKEKISADKEYKSVKGAKGESVYLTGKEEKYTSAYWSLRFALADLMDVSDTQDMYNSFRYGLAGDFTWEYQFPRMTFGFDADAEAILIALYNDDKSMLSSFKIAPKLYFKNLSDKLAFRTGVAGFINANYKDESVLQGTFITPLVGIGFDHVKIGDKKLSGYYDYYFGHFAYDNLKSAMGAGINLCIPIAEMEKMQMGFNIGVKDDLFIKTEGIENRASVLLAVGVENVTD
jgi:hypothetical protein